ncbi:unnamed protein product [Closterium sp. NIES-64]|nr:unnamed protein product [Closterium sp. NIES-64]
MGAGEAGVVQIWWGGEVYWLHGAHLGRREGKGGAEGQREQRKDVKDRMRVRAGERQVRVYETLSTILTTCVPHPPRRSVSTAWPMRFTRFCFRVCLSFLRLTPMLSHVAQFTSTRSPSQPPPLPPRFPHSRLLSRPSLRPRSCPWRALSPIPSLPPLTTPPPASSPPSCSASCPVFSHPAQRFRQTRTTHAHIFPLPSMRLPLPLRTAAHHCWPHLRPFSHWRANLLPQTLEEAAVEVRAQRGWRRLGEYPRGARLARASVAFSSRRRHPRLCCSQRCDNAAATGFRRRGAPPARACLPQPPLQLFLAHLLSRL